jgi:putative N6-adenine-specific DNA methylase
MQGWRLALVTSDARLAKATGLNLEACTAPVPHGGLKIRLYISAAQA